MGDKSRPYNPVSRIDEPGLVDLFVRDLRKENTASSFTNRLLNLKVRVRSSRKGTKSLSRDRRLSLFTTATASWSGKVVPPKFINILAS